MRLCVVALNPAIDAEWRVDDLLWEEKNVVHTARRWAGGKGINVARWLQSLGAEVELLLPLGGPTGREMEAQLHAWKIPARIIPLREDSRVNVVVTTAVGRQMRLNQPGPQLDKHEWAQVFQQAEQALQAGAALVLSGSLPRHAPVNVYARLTRLARRYDAKVFLDCDGPALTAAARAQPFLVKPNVHELSLWAGKKLRSENSIIAAASALSNQTDGWVLVSRGADGALLVNVREPFLAGTRARAGRVRNTVGAGDALLAAAVHQVTRGAEPLVWLQAGVLAGTAATAQWAGELPAQSIMDRLARHSV